MRDSRYSIETEPETDGRWIAEIVDLPGVMAYGGSRDEAVALAEALAFRVIADPVEQQRSAVASVSFACE